MLIFRSVIPYVIKSLSCANPRIPIHQWIIRWYCDKVIFSCFHFFLKNTIPRIHWAEKSRRTSLGKETLYIRHLREIGQQNPTHQTQSPRVSPGFFVTTFTQFQVWTPRSKLIKLINSPSAVCGRSCKMRLRRRRGGVKDGVGFGVWGRGGAPGLRVRYGRSST